MFNVGAGANVSFESLSMVGGGIGLGPGASVAIKDVGAGPCPSCRLGTAIFADGIYRSSEDLAEFLISPSSSYERLREVALVFADAAEDGPAPNRVGKQLDGAFPRFITWMKEHAFSKDARKKLYGALATALLGALAERGLGAVLDHREPATTVINNYNTTIEQYIESDERRARERHLHIQEVRKHLHKAKIVDT